SPILVHPSLYPRSLHDALPISASLGGISTLIGTPPNSLFKGAVSQIYDMDISFARWMLFGVPFAWIFILVAWFYLIKFAFPNKIDRKSTRLNYSHVSISYAVFC